MMSTLIIGARCTDGVVLAADRKELRGYEPSERSKVRQIEFAAARKGVSVLLAGAGVAAFWDELAWTFSRDMASEDRPNITSLLDAVDRISRYSLTLASRYQRDGLNEPLGCVAGGFAELSSGEPEMYYFAGAGFSKTDFICLGSGDTYALPIATALLSDSRLTCDEAVSALAFVFLLVERVNVSVGGVPDIYVLRNGGKVPRQIATQQMEKTHRMAHSLVEILPRVFPRLAENPDILRALTKS